MHVHVHVLAHVCTESEFARLVINHLQFKFYAMIVIATTFAADPPYIYATSKMEYFQLYCTTVLHIDLGCRSINGSVE